jgi:hypothetical protein
MDSRLLSFTTKGKKCWELSMPDTITAIEKLDIHGKLFYIPESFNTNISHQLFEYIITFVNSQH